MYDCGDGALPVLNEEECKLIWCSSLNKRVLFAQDCPFSKCPDGEELFNLNFCKNYDCADGSEVNAPEECNKFVCADGNKIDDIKKCVEYCEAPSDCNPNKAELKSCFGEWGCMNNTCAWNCEENFTSNTAKEIAISLEEIVGEGYSKLSDEKEEENEKGTVYVSAFENQREKVSFMQLISIPNQGISKTELANKFNGAINELIKKGLNH